ncbi:MAG: hypothetical protein GQ574_18525 [Crocinitomix sp.]|nr:hypothetical protein [Crocinitomix sp.]
MSDRNIIIALILLQLVLCLPVIGLFPISLDEPFSIYHAQFPVDEMLTEVAQGNNSPLHFIGLHYWIKIFGISPLSVRSLSLLISLISIVFLYKLGRKLWNKKYAVILVVLFILSRLDHLVAMEARMYGLFTLFFILIIYDFYRLLFEDKKVFITLGIWNALLLYTHYLGGVVILMECLIFIAYFSKWNRNKWIQVGLTAGLSVLLFIPGIQIFLNRAADFNASGSWVPEAELYDLVANLIKLLNNRFTLFATIAIVALLTYLSRANLKSNQFKKWPFFMLWFLGTYLLMFAISWTVQPIFFIKYLQFLSIPLFILIVGCVAQNNFTASKKYLPFLLLVPFMASYRFVPDVNRETDKMIDYIKEIKTSNTVVLYCPEHYELTLAYHYDLRSFSAYENTSNQMKAAGFQSIYEPEDIILQTGVDQIIYLDLDTKLLNPDNGIISNLDNTFRFVESKTFKGNFTVYRYQNE